MNRFKTVLFVCLIVLSQENLLAVTEQATFHSFYVESSYIGWILAAIAAIAAGAAIFFSGGTATPVVAGIGTWIGEMAGLSGAAATNYGLALLGGGSIVSGGLGIAGGTAVLTAALTFSTEVVIDYTVGSAYKTYSYSKFVEESKKMPTLPIPQNEEGSSSYEDAVVFLKENIKTQESLFSNENQKVLRDALKQYRLNDDNIKESVLKSYLFFVTNDYDDAKEQAMLAIRKAREEQIRRTLPAFIYAVSSMYQQQIDFDTINHDFFRYSVLAENDNKLIPLMFAIYLDRIMYRMNDDEALNYTTLNKVKEIAFELDEDDIKLQSLVVVMMRYFIRIKIEQQKILALVDTANEKIKNSPKTLKILQSSFQEYKNLLVSMRDILFDQEIQEYIEDDKKLKHLNILYAKYEENEKYLALKIAEFKRYQKSQRSWYEKYFIGTFG